MDLKNIAIDVKGELDGKWVKIFDGQIQVKVARMYNKHYAKAYSEAVEPVKLEIRAGTLSDDKQQALLCDVFARTILLDWQGVEVDGKELPYSYENAKMLLLDPSLRLFREAVLEESMRGVNFKLLAEADGVERLKKN